MKILLTIILLTTTICNKQVDEYNSMPTILMKTKNTSNDYENQGQFHSTHVLLNGDSSFVYWSVFEGGYDLTIGKYTQKNNTMTFNWDSAKTYQAVANRSIYKKYYQYGRPLSHVIEKMKYRIKKDTLEYIN